MITSSCIRASRQLNTTRPSMSIRHGLSTFVPSIHIPKDNDNDDTENNNERQPRFHMPIINHNHNNNIVESAPYNYNNASHYNNNGTYYSNYNYNNNNMTTLRQYHTTPPSNRGAALALTLGAVAATAKAGQYAIQGYKEWKEENDRLEEELKKNPPPPPPPTAQEEGNTAKAENDGNGNAREKRAEDNTGAGAGAGAGGAKQKEGKRENIFANFFNMSVGSKYYEGGFEDTMTRKEAALILGVRESSATKRIKEAHRKLLILNHPDTGGSTYLSGKLNEAKELLLKGKK